MSASAAKKERLPINPAMLRWARDWSARTIDEAAKKVKQPRERVESWEVREAAEAPTVKQARKLAEFYGRSFLELFRSDVPDIPPLRLAPDFRLYPHKVAPKKDHELREIQSWAESIRLNALDLYDDLVDEPPVFPQDLRATVKDDVERVAARARETLHFAIEDQVGIVQAERDQLPNRLRQKLESVGVLALRHAKLRKAGARGICLTEFPLPVVVFGNEAPTAQAFTIVHELGHIILRQSAVIGSLPKTGGDPNKRTVEEWCNQFAAAFLVPKDYLGARSKKPDRPAAKMANEELVSLARHFGVSQHVMLIRLVHLGYVAESYYWNQKRPEFEKQEQEWKSSGRSKYYGSRYRSAAGDLYTGLVLEAWSTGRITNHHAAEFMGIKSHRHLYDIRRAFGD